MTLIIRTLTPTLVPLESGKRVDVAFVIGDEIRVYEKS